MRKAMIAFAALLWGAFAAAQQTGGIEGVVTLRGATTAADIVVVAESDVMPRARTTKIDAEGRYALPQLIPGVYRVTFKMTNGASRMVTATVLLDQTTVLRVEFEPPHAPEI